MPGPTRRRSASAVLVVAMTVACPGPSVGLRPADPSLRATPEPVMPANGTISTADLEWRVYRIADDSMRGRYPGTPGNVKVTAFVAAEFRRFGLTPAGDNGTYYQNVPFVSTTLDTTVTLSLGGQPLERWRDYIPINPIHTSNRFDAASAPVTVYAGRLGDSLTVPPGDGRLVVFSLGRRPDGSPDARSTRFLPTARLAGAAAVVIVYPGALPQSIADSYHQRHFSLPPEAGAHRPMLLLVNSRVGEALIASTETVLRGSVRFTGPDTVLARNVVAVFPGVDPARRGEYVAIGAHNDHIGVAAHAVDHDSLRAYNTLLARRHLDGPSAGNPGAARDALHDSIVLVNVDSLRRRRAPRRDSIFNGADDDGSGTAALLAIAQAFATAPTRPARSIVFVSHAGEEQGLLGSHWYADHPTVPGDSIVAYLNMDMLGHGDSADVAGGGPRYVQSGGARHLSREYGALVDSVNAGLAEPMAIDYSWDAPGHPSQKYCRSDQVSYGRHGIPSAYFSTGYSVDYHQVTDEPQYLDYPHLARVVRLVYAVARRVADLDHAPIIDGPKPDPNAPCRQ
ncbi:MAG TPA: M28 family peptidase [Gemmatimonadaceae bacterium]|nr:M28 family peptidase [Gemmatimonadaceae bacterium]